MKYIKDLGIRCGHCTAVITNYKNITKHHITTLDHIALNKFCSNSCKKSFIYDYNTVKFTEFEQEVLDNISDDDLTNIIKETPNLNTAFRLNKFILHKICMKYFSLFSEVDFNIKELLSTIKFNNAQIKRCLNPECKSNNRIKILGSGRINDYCSNSCAQSSLEVQNKIKSTTLSKYGVENVANSEIISEKKRLTSLSRYGTEYSFQSEEVKAKITATNIEKYGTSNINAVESIRHKIQKTNLEKYGCKHTFQSPEVKQKIKHTLETRYGADHPLKTANKTKTFNTFSRFSDLMIPQFTLEEYIETRKKSDKYSQKFEWLCNRCESKFKYGYYDGKRPKCPNCDLSFSAPEYFIQEILTSANIEFQQNDRTTISPYELDFIIHNKRIAIECNGNYWHSELSGRGKTYHLNKTQECNKAGYDLIHILESEINNEPELVKNRILSKLGVLPATRIHTRQCTVEEINTNTKCEFLNRFHIQGNDSSSIRLGLFYETELISVMTFCKLRKALGSKHSDGSWELSRFCSNYEYIAPGNGSKLLKHFIRSYNPKRILSYCDLRWNTGKSYHNMGFDLVSQSPPNYWYVNCSNYQKLFHRFNFRKNILNEKLESFDESLTEWENMKNNGYDRIWDCGNLKFEMLL